MPICPNSGVYYETFGAGPALFAGFPLMASYGEIFGADQSPILTKFLGHFSDRYRVIVADYPSIGKSASIPPEQLTADRVCADILSVADAAGADRFAWYGYAWGASVGLQLASRTDRLSALVVGGWSPLGGPYAEMLAASLANVNDPPDYARVVLREPQQYAQWVAYYRSIQGWPEADEARRIACPRLAFVGELADTHAGGTAIAYATALKSNRNVLEAMGWEVEILQNRKHEVGLDPDAVGPLVRRFLHRTV